MSITIPGAIAYFVEIGAAIGVAAALMFALRAVKLI